MKTKIPVEKIGKYLRELSIIVVGIAITFTISNWITSKNNKKDIELYLDAVKIELQDNLQLVNRNRNYYKRAVDYGRYLSDNRQNLHTDTLNHYFYLNKFMPFFMYKTSAFDLLKSSGTVLLIKDKRKVEAIWDSYAALEGVKLFSEFYIQRKIAEMEKNTNSMFDDMKSETLFPFFTNILHRDLYNECNSCSENIEQMLSKL
jgi:hypothetical protein